MSTHATRSLFTVLPLCLFTAVYACSSTDSNGSSPSVPVLPGDAGAMATDGAAPVSPDASSDAGADAAIAATLDGLQTIKTVSSTVDPTNGDVNPYAIAAAPTTFKGDGVAGHVQPGDLLVSNFSNASGTQFAGTTFEAIRQGSPVRVFAEANAPTVAGGTVSSSGPVALAFAPNGNLWIANFGSKGDGSDGNVQIVTPAGVVAKTFTDPSVAGGWGQEFNHKSGGHLAFFTVNIVTGTVARINIIVTDAGPPSFTIDPLTGDLGHASTTAFGTPTGPGGLVHDPMTDTLYVVNGHTNAIVAIANASTTTTLTTGAPVYQGTPLNQPALMTRNPLNGDLIVANQLDNRLVEITTSGHLVATKVVDPAPVDTSGKGSALFGVAAAIDAHGSLEVYFVDDNDNTVKSLSR